MDRFSPIAQYTYIGFGGHSLEDFKHLHDRFGLSEMISLESNVEVFKRQEFNKPYKCISIKNIDSQNFIDEHPWDEQKQTIVWLDYTEPSKLRIHLEEFQQVLRKLGNLDILKITLNANAASYAETKSSDFPDEINRRRINQLESLLGKEDLFPSISVKEEMMTSKKFPHALVLILQHAAELALESFDNIYFQLLTCFSYADGQTMVTISGIILDKSKHGKFLEETEIQQWALSTTDWSAPTSINIPDLTIRERLFIDQLLPDLKPHEIQEQLGFMFGKENESLEMLETYIMFYRQSPYFSKILVWASRKMFTRKTLSK